MPKDRGPVSPEAKARRVVLVLLGLALAAVTAVASLWVLRLRDPDTLERFREAVGAMGPGGWILLLGIQYLQILIAFIPGGPIQMVAGALYGPVLGAAVCFAGTVLATATVFALVSRYGRRVVALFVEDKDVRTYQFVQNEQQLERLIVILFLIPGTPKDALTYLFALTPVPMRRFLALSIAARLPAVLTSVLAGDRVIKGEWVQAGALFSAICLLGLAGFLLRRKILSVSQKRHG